MRRILVIGGESHLGSALAAAHQQRGDEVHVTTRRSPAGSVGYLDLAHVPVRWQPPVQTDIAYVCAGITSIQHCEERPEDTARVNVQGILDVCRALSRAGAFVVFFSTNLVFDGEIPHVTVETHPRPCCEYGRQKAAVEAALRDEAIPSVVIRLTKVIDRSHPLLKSWTAALQRNEPIAPFTDMTMAPITLECAVRASVAAAGRKSGGIVHLSAARDISYFEVAHHLAKCLGAPGELVRPNTARRTLPPDRFIPQHTTLAPSVHAPVHFTPPDPLLAIEACITGAAAPTILV
jgi:dTDP-4-dehydrorhamnose reductase